MGTGRQGKVRLSGTTEALLDEVTEELWLCQTRVKDNDTDEVPLREDEHRALSPLLDRGFDIVGTGLARVVLAFPDDSEASGHVVKLGRFGDELLSIGMWQNRNELAVWADVLYEVSTECAEDVDVPLMPVKGYQPGMFRWLIMPEAAPLPDDEAEELVDEVKRGMVDCPAELHSTEYDAVNVRLYDGEPRLVDYGRPHEHSLRVFQSGVPSEVKEKLLGES